MMTIQTFRSMAARVPVAFVILLELVAPALSRERGPRVEVVCPMPPEPVRIDKQQVLVYELHITNFDVVPLTLTRLQVFANELKGTLLGTFANASLAASMITVGAKPAEPGKDSAKDARTIEPGTRSVVYMWIELPSNQAVPTSLRHRMEFTTGEGASAAILEDYAVPVGRDVAPTLSPPFRGGIWVAAGGPSNNSNHRRSIFAIDGQIYSPERFAIDWIKVGPNGDSRHDGATRNENWWSYGEPVLAVADGEVTEVVDGIADNVPRNIPPVTLDNILGNHVILKISPTRYVTYAHLQEGSIRVKLHEQVKQGMVLALLGNSGNTTGAHLHMQVTDRNSALESEGVPFVFSRFTYLGPGADYEIDKHVSVPWRDSIPPGDGVVELGEEK